MSMRSKAALQVGFLLVAVLTSAVSKNAIRIKVLDSETRSVSLADNGVPNNCEQVTFDAYCRTSRTPLLKYTLLVQEGDQPPFHISCTVESKWSRCKALPIGETFDAKREKRGLVVYYIDDKGKARSQLYTLVAGSTMPPAPAASQAAPAAAPAPVAPATSTSASPAASAPQSAASTQDAASVKCNFTSTPSGAEIDVDGRFVGSTPSEIAVGTGTHVVVLALPGFAEWKRDLTITPGSGVINVAASLQKAP